MGTTWSARIIAPSEHDEASCRATIIAAFDAVIAAMSGWDEASELCAFNRAAPGEWRSLSDGFWSVLTRALELADATDGAFSPTLGAVVGARGFGPSPPSAAQLSHNGFEEAERRAWRDITLDAGAHAARQPGGVTLDLSAIAKGYAVDLAVERLRDVGVSHALLEIGGEFRGAGVKPDGQPWWVSLEHPPGAEGVADTDEFIIALHGMSVATSGSYRRVRSVDGALISHIVTADPPSGALASVSVLHPQCMEADACATALFAMGEEAGIAFAQTHGLAAVFVSRAEDGRPMSRVTASVTAMLDDQE